MCECGLFPAYSQQVRSPTSDAPIQDLPSPFKALCLECIAQLAGEHTDHITDGSPCWARVCVPGLVASFSSQSMLDTYEACYKGYYTAKYAEDAQQAAPSINIQRAFCWIGTSSHEYSQGLDEADKGAADGVQASVQEAAQSQM